MVQVYQLFFPFLTHSNLVFSSHPISMQFVQALFRDRSWLQGLSGWWRCVCAHLCVWEGTQTLPNWSGACQPETEPLSELFTNQPPFFFLPPPLLQKSFRRHLANVHSIHAMIVFTLCVSHFFHNFESQVQALFFLGTCLIPCTWLSTFRGKLVYGMRGWTTFQKKSHAVWIAMSKRKLNKKCYFPHLVYRHFWSLLLYRCNVLFPERQAPVWCTLTYQICWSFHSDAFVLNVLFLALAFWFQWWNTSANFCPL